MAALIEFPVEGNERVFVEVAGPLPRGLAPVADANVAGKSAKTFEEAVSGLGPIARSIFNAIQGLAKRPTEVAVELGFKISGSGSLILCSTQAEANFKATLKWVESSDT
jgi:hypothetical protein